MRLMPFPGYIEDKQNRDSSSREEHNVYVSVSKSALLPGGRSAYFRVVIMTVSLAVFTTIGVFHANLSPYFPIDIAAMPKRPRSPSVEESTLSLQCKTHLSDRMFLKSVHGQDQLSSVYEKTLNMLYRGSRNLAIQQSGSMDVCDGVIQSNGVDIPSDQMRLSPNLQLLRLNTNTEHTGYNHPTPDKAHHSGGSYEVCQICRIPSTFLFGRCGFCEKAFCQKCLQPCIQCNTDYCILCSLPVYRTDEARLCTSCSARPTSQLGFYP